MFKEFKEFALKGNVIDLAVGVIIGSAFSKIVNSLVSDVIMPLLSPIVGKLDYSNLVLGMNGVFYNKLEDAAKAKAEGIAMLNYGLFITNVINFLIVAFAIFIVIRQINRLRPRPPAPAPTTKACPYCKSTIHIEAVKCPFCASDVEGK
jgi:large conductance mechanosensitive channel